MASRTNDQLQERTVDGPLNYYDGHRACGTAFDKGLASRLGGHNYNIISNNERDEIYFRDMRHADHYIDKKGRHTEHFFGGGRRRKFEGDERNLMWGIFKTPDEHPREKCVEQRRTEVQVAQIENAQSFNGFQNRCQKSLFPNEPKKRYSIHNKLYANEVGKLRPAMTTKDGFLQRRGDTMTRTISAPSVLRADPVASLEQALHQDRRKDASQRQTESAHFARSMSNCSYSMSLDMSDEGRRHKGEQQSCSVNRLENHDFGITRKNNHFSSKDKLTRSDPYFMRPRLGITNNSVKYDIVNNERRWFRY